MTWGSSRRGQRPESTSFAAEGFDAVGAVAVGAVALLGQSNDAEVRRPLVTEGEVGTLRADRLLAFKTGIPRPLPPPLGQRRPLRRRSPSGGPNYSSTSLGLRTRSIPARISRSRTGSSEPIFSTSSSLSTV